MFCALLLAGFSQAQTVRYLDEIFSTVKIDSNITYGQNKTFGSGFNASQQLKMDVYRPEGDTATSRPVVILMHAGSFLDGSLTGFNFADKNEHCIVELCNRFAKRGYVAVSMTYRLGWNPTAPDQDTKSKTIINAVYRAMQDVKNCIRYFRHDVDSNSNQWGIDPTRFVLGGSNSGAYVALAAGNLNKPAELEIPKVLDLNGIPYIDTTLTGNFDGFGGTQNTNNYPGYSSAFNAVLALGGAVADTSLIEAGETPVIAFQGADETLTPYNTAVVITTTLQPVIEVSGSGDFMPVVERMGLNSGFSPNSFAAGPKNIQGGVQTTSIDGLYPFYGQSFEPWNWYDGTNPSINPTASQTKAQRYIDTIMGYTTPRLYRLLIDDTYGEPTGIREVKGRVEMRAFPNPASSVLHVAINTLQQPMQSLAIVDLTGRTVAEMKDMNAYDQPVDVSNLSNGVYLLSVKLKDGNSNTVRFTVER
jgi:predicted esterase